MNALFPIGGVGQRFVDAGYAIPKPLIKVGGIHLIERAMKCFIDYNIALVSYPLILEHLHHVNCYAMNIVHPTLNPIDTLNKPKVLEWLKNKTNIYIADCDSIIDPIELKLAAQHFVRKGANGGVLFRYTNDPACSFVDLSIDWYVNSSREKDPFTPYSSTGPYWFKNGEELVHIIQKSHKKSGTSVSELYNLMNNVVGYPTFTFKHLGTPESLKQYADNYGFDIQW